ncbi:autotransporter outer membrane beta-barrel domain-containing protein [Nitrosococcus wardiae]|uniref:Autotransporter outer membrane beta-barrel domain-containing protein n=1 Tax=Nitrosococcus wardiae TaxID=1814290 RepID=A0A4P7BUZ2_9GAMM|nr:autotransporter outer membrane beta-barrel domain-containing protein [Nitrosococcus wardiae]QBQ53097.1 autotransporter outer membrane beta-barrel domain-containing protein [Nitrosococcus wardiae]
MLKIAFSRLSKASLSRGGLQKHSFSWFLLQLSTLVALVGLGNPLEAQVPENLASGLNPTQSNIERVILDVCPRGLEFGNSTAFQERCNALVGAAGEPEVRNALQRVSPEQIISQGTESTKAVRILQFNRILALRTGAHGLLAGYDVDGQPTAVAWSPSNRTGGAAGADGADIWSRLGIFVNGLGGFGDVDSTFNQLGFDFDSSGVIAGVDYRFTDNFILGLAFNYLRTDTDFDREGGQLDSDTYSGSIYGTFYATNSFHVDWVATYGGIDYDSTRNISYAVPGDVVNTQSTSSPEGNQFSAAISAGYDFSLNALTISPYVRGEYINLDIDSFSERDILGWGVRYSDQTIESLTTAVGTQIAYAVSTQWGVLQPFIRGEWFHEYEDDSRNISATFVEAGGNVPFNIVTESPDRNFYTFGVGISGTFAKGVSAFFNYDVLLDREDISSHVFLVGARMEL